MERRRKRGAWSGEATTDDELDAAAVADELSMVKQAIAEHEALLANHRLAIVEGRPSPYRDEDIANTHAVLDSLHANLHALEIAAALTAEVESVVEAGDTRRLPPLDAAGPVQSGILRRYESGVKRG